MVSHETLWDKNTGEILEDAIIPDVDIPAQLNVKVWDCDTDLKQYANTLLCDGDEAIAIMTAEDKNGFYVETDLRVRGEVTVGYRKDPEDDYVWYKHFSQFPPELTDALKSGEWNDDHVYVDDSNWLETIYRIYNPAGEEIWSDGIMFEDDISKMTPDDVKAYLLETSSYIMEQEYDTGKLEKPATTLNDVLMYANAKYHDASLGDDIALRNFPDKGVETVFTKDKEMETVFSTSVFEMKSNKLIAESHDHVYADFFNHIMDLATGEEKMGDKTLKDVLKDKGSIEKGDD